MSHPKPSRVTDRALLDSYHSKRCAVCGRLGCDPCHVSSVGSRADDVADNVMPLCRVHHTEQHSIGWVTFCRRYRGIEQYLRWKGWEISDGKLRRRHGFPSVNGF